MEMQQRILQKATRLFMHYGIRSVTMDEIAEQLGISKKTIYQFFADKNELVEAVIQRIVDNNRTCCEADQAFAKNAIEEVFMAIELIKSMFADMNPSIMNDLEKYHSSAFEKFTQYKYNFLFRVIRENLLRGIREELYREDINVEVITQLRLETMMLPFSPNVFTKGKYNPAQVHEEVMEHYLFGIASLKGYKMILKYKEERRNKTHQHEL